MNTCHDINLNAGMIFFRVVKYLKYIFLSKNRKGHGIHSPFVFDLVNRVFRNKPDAAVVYRIERVRKRLIQDHRVITVNDLGSGSEYGRTKLKKISDIARYSAVTPKYGIFLANMAAEFGCPLIMEFGTSLGISTMYLALSASAATVYTMEGCNATAEIATRNFDEEGVKNLKLFVGSFEEILPEISQVGIAPGLVFIDGNHRKKPLLEYFEKMTKISDSKTVIIIDDINYSIEMEEAWSEIKRHEKVSLTIDIFRMGIVFFREGIIHNNYIIRY